MTGQISIAQYLRERNGTPAMHCGDCICKSCLYGASERCPYSGCYDDHRVAVEPYGQAHPGKPPRTAWSDWDKPGEQAHWCRGGVFYPAHDCINFQPYQGSQVKECLGALVTVFQDGYVLCSLAESEGCPECYRQFERRKNGP